MIALEVGIKALSVNEAFQGRRYKTAKFKDFEAQVNLLLPRRKTPMRGQVEISYTFFLTNASRTDVDNLIKCFQDILVKKNYIEDDRKIYRIHAEKVAHSSDFIHFAIQPYKK